jgi:hypothetical protein
VRFAMAASLSITATFLGIDDSVPSVIRDLRYLFPKTD